MRKRGSEQAPKTCEGCSRWKEIRNKLRISSLVEKAAEAFEKKINADDLKPSLAEYLKLLQMEQEIEAESPKEIKVTWVEPQAPSSAK